MIERITVLFLLIAGASLSPFMTAATDGSETQRHQVRQETDNKVREMANETYVNRVKTSDKHQ